MKYKKTSLCLLFFLLALFITGCNTNKPTDPINRTSFKLNTIINITIYDSKDEVLLDECMNLCDKYEKIFSRTNIHSELYKINSILKNPQSSQLSFELSEDLGILLDKGLLYSKKSNGAMDITVEPLTSQWDFNSTESVIPDYTLIKEKLPLIDYRNITITENNITFSQKNMGLDVGAVAKGYIADKIKEYLISQGVKSAMINLGGNVLCIGMRPDGAGFKIGIQKPFANKNETIKILDINNLSVVSSGVYERYFMKNDTRYHHIINPKTGFPYNNDLTAVTIISEKSVDGDGLSTACFSLGLEKGMELIESLDNTYAMFITEDNTLHYSKGFEKFIANE